MIISDHIFMKITVDFAWVCRWFAIGVIVVVVVIVVGVNVVVVALFVVTDHILLSCGQ